MRQVLNKLKESYKLWRLRRNSMRPRLLPVGATDYQEFCDDIIKLSGQFADRDSMIYAISGVVINLKHDVHAIPMDYMVRCLRKTAANQVASAEFQRIMEEHKQKQAEATALANKALADATSEKV